MPGRPSILGSMPAREYYRKNSLTEGNNVYSFAMAYLECTIDNFKVWGIMDAIDALRRHYPFHILGYSFTLH